MKKLNLGQKVLLANLTTILIFALTAIISIVILQDSREALKKSSNDINPSVEMLERFVLMATKAKNVYYQLGIFTKQ